MNPPTRLRALEEAERWIGTPYRHQGSRIGVGCDCLGLVRGIWRAIYGREAETPPAYTRDWAECGDADALRRAAHRHLQPIAIARAEAGDVLLFALRDGRVVKHCGIAADGERLIHAYSGAGVVSSPLTPSWRRRIAGAFRFPEATTG